MLNAQWVRTFAVLIDAGSFTKAAERMGLTQAAVSQHVRHLEDELGPLLIRRPRALELTPSGSALLDYCREVELADQRMRSRLSDADAATGEVSLITPGSIGLFLYPKLLDLQQARPGITIRHRFAPDNEVLDAVLQNRFEVGLITLKPDDPRIVASPFAEEALELIVPASEEVQRWTDLERIGFIDHPDGLAMATRLLSQNFPGLCSGQKLPVHGFSNQVGLILEPVARGLGSTVLPRYARQAFRYQEAIRVVDLDTPVVDTLWLIHRSEWPLRARTVWIMDQLRKCVSVSVAMGRS
ncbi:DNA-binding transcriptional LysR family regulator [Methylobacterium sp. PvP062]|uniref:DNA-binding transcriptional LysR family regulator n=1 Tax=Methylobacterium radiotolerans TaxID=31998 RepID=A0ABV2NTT9_9HYPH|nr:MULTISPECIES: LysR family transcriptional regulator [unclassified Methylobacterium]MBP2498305.1 DNA-binding transcriptional LysR family regulator [Methylobacterium sp. PvP105]MBP2505689.1 DNA-binding transcriptional LysR family regulator [Methylobacterium sp. PvP109]